MNLDEFYNYKNRLMKDLLTNEDVISLLDDEGLTQNPTDLAYTQVFPCEYVPDTVEHGKTYICFDVDIQKSSGKTFYSPILYIWVFTHKSKLRLEEGGIRTDKLCSQICQIINGSRNYGLGELCLYSVKRFAPMTDFQGKVMTFHADDVNKFHDPNRKIPFNRKEI